MSTTEILRVKKLRSGAKLPDQATFGSACHDVHALLDDSETVKTYSELLGNPYETPIIDGIIQLEHLHRYMIPTGLSFEIPTGHVIKAYPRSGLALKKGLCLSNTPGVIDSDYRGELMILITNYGPRTTISHGERIAQIMLEKVILMKLQEVDTLSETERGSGGFGSTGSH